MNIIHEILQKMTGISKPKQKFIENLFYTILSMGGKMNFRNISRYANYHEKTFSRNFSQPFDYLQFNIIAVNRVISETKRYGIGYDPFFIKKSGKHTYGRESFWNGSSSKSEKGLEGNGFALIDIDNKTAYPLAVQQTPPKDEIEKLIGMNEITRMDFYVRCANDHLKKIKSNNLETNTKHIIVDSYFANKKFVSMTLKNDFHVVSRLRCDANLRHLNIEQKRGRGRPKKYAEKVEVRALKSFNFVCNIDDRHALYEGIFYNINLKRMIKVACLVSMRGKKRAMVLMFSTDLSLSAKDILDFYTARFQIEFVFRDCKQFAGLNECQARSKERIHNHLNTSITALLLAKIQDVAARANIDRRVLFSMESHKRKNYNEMLVKRIFSNLDLDQSLIKFHPGIKNTIELGVIRC